MTLSLLAACTAERATRPVVAPASSAPAASAVVPSAPSGSATASPSRKETFVHVGDCSSNESIEPQAGCTDLLSARNLPAIDAAKSRLAVAAREEHGLGTPWNLTVKLLSAKDGAVGETLPVFVEADYAAFDTTSKKGLVMIQAAMDARAAVVERRLVDGGFVPLSACVSDPSSTNDAPFWCGGHDRWTCGDVSLSLTGPSGSQVRDTLTLQQGKSAKKLSTKTWRKPPVSDPNQPPKGTIQAGFCISAAHQVAASRVLLQVTHVCLGGGDWCSPGGPTFHVVGD